MLSNDDEFVQSIKFLFPEMSTILIEILEDCLSHNNESIFKFGDDINHEITNKEEGIVDLKKQMLYESLSSPETFQKITSHRFHINFLKAQAKAFSDFCVIDFSHESLRDDLIKRFMVSAEEFSANTQSMVEEYISFHRNNGIRLFPMYINAGSIVSAYHRMWDDISKDLDKHLEDENYVIPLSYKMSIASIIPKFFYVDDASYRPGTPWNSVVNLCSTCGFHSIRDKKIEGIPDHSAYRLIALGFNNRIKLNLQTVVKPEKGRLNFLFSPKMTSHLFEVYE